MIVLFGYFLQAIGIDVTSNSLGSEILSFCIYFAYFCLAIYKFGSTVGLYFWGIKVDFVKSSFLLGKIFLRELIYLTILTGIGFICYLIWGPYWDRATGARVIITKD